MGREQSANREEEARGGGVGVRHSYSTLVILTSGPTVSLQIALRTQREERRLQIAVGTIH